jgi:hypothetical protein
LPTLKCVPLLYQPFYNITYKKICLTLFKNILS